MLIRKAIIAAIAASGFAIAGCDVDQTEEGNMPDYDVSQTEDGNLPEYEVTQTEDGNLPDYNVDQTREGNLPEYDVDPADVDVRTEERTVEVPTGIEVTSPEDDEYAATEEDDTYAATDDDGSG